jgi:hypothetical protein
MAFVTTSTVVAPVVAVIGIAGLRARKIAVSAFMGNFVAPLCLLILGITIAAASERSQTRRSNHCVERTGGSLHARFSS